MAEWLKNPVTIIGLLVLAAATATAIWSNFSSRPPKGDQNDQG